MSFQFSFRQQQILDIARQAGRVTVDSLAARFSVTPQTIRKDLNDLCDHRILARTHGGAILSSGVENVAYDARRNLARSEKQAIGQRAAALIPNNSSLVVNIGTTTEEVARHLTLHEGLMVITNNLHVAHILTPSPRIEVMIAGGMVRKPDGGIVGESAVEFISQFRVDRAVIGASAIDDDGALLDFDYREVMVARAILKNARHTILVADSMKFSRTAPVRIGHISQVDVFVTDRPLPDGIAEVCRQNDVIVEIVPGFEEHEATNELAAGSAAEADVQ
jgi:DeoR family transcriptional regulator, glycerol-3-phosphate regulon repressor